MGGENFNPIAYYYYPWPDNLLGLDGNAPVLSSPQSTLSTITLSPATTSLTFLGQTIELSANTLDQYGNPVSAQSPLTWTSNNTSVATVNSTGLVTAVGAGSANIIASNGAVPRIPTIVTVSLASCGTLSPGISLSPGQIIKSCNGSYELYFQPSGKLVFYKLNPTSALWGTPVSTATTDPGKTLSLGTNGSLNLYDASGNLVWSSLQNGGKTGTAINLTVSNNGSLIISGSGNSVLWQYPAVSSQAASVFDGIGSFIKNAWDDFLRIF